MLAVNARDAIEWMTVQAAYRPRQQMATRPKKELNMKTTHVWTGYMSVVATLAIAATLSAQPVPSVNSTPQPVTAYEPAAPAAINRDSDALQPQPDAATRTEIGDRAVGGAAAFPPAPGQLQPMQSEAIETGPFASGQATASSTRRGELGVWLASSGGAGVEVRRITAGSPAAQAGLRSGDIILQVNGRGATSPLAVSQMIRSLPAGQAVTIEVWRDGQQQELQAMLRPVRDPYETAYRGETTAIGGGSSDLASRTMRLEEQLAMVMQELRALRQEMAQLRMSASSTAPATRDALPAADTDPGFSDFDQPATSATAPAATTTAPAAIAEPAADASDPFNDESAAPATEPVAEPAAEPATEPAAEEDVFGTETTEDTAGTTPATESAGAAATEAQPAEGAETEAESDDIFE
jgi:hypothetical protein